MTDLTMTYLKVQPNAMLLHRVIRPFLHLVALLPLASLVISAFTGNLGVNPVEALTHETGEWALRLLLISLAITPLIKVTGNAWLILLRRPLGLYSFFYAFLHFLVYLIFDQELSLNYLIEDIVDRPYITVGFGALVLMLPLVITSTKSMRRRLKKRWDSLHKLTYIIAIGGLIHLIWLTRADYKSAWTYSIIFVLLMLFRIRRTTRK